MSTQVQTGQWTEDGGRLLSQPLLNFAARRRIAISLCGFIGLTLYNLFVRQTIPLSPFSIGDLRTAVAIGLLGLGLGIRSWAAGTLNKSREVTQQGPYALSRNPLYVGSFLMMFGFCILMQDLVCFLFVAGPMAFLYWLQIQFEEKRLGFMFPDSWPDYFNRVPRVLSFRWNQEALKGWTRFEWLRNREYKTILASFGGLLAVYVWRIISLQLWS